MPLIRKRGITIEHLWVAAPFFVILVKAFRVPLPLLDFWWHLKMGEIIALTHSIPRTDLFSFTATGKPFTVQNWLGEILLYWVYKLGGFPLLIFFNAAMLALVLLLVFLLCREATNRLRLAAFSTLLAGLAFPCNLRPQVFSFVLFAFFYWILDGYRSGRRNKLWLLPLATVVWVNLHGAFVIGLGLIAVILVTGTVCRLTSRGQEYVLSSTQLRNLGFAFIACALATLLNPETYKIYDYIRVVLSDQASQKLVMEWQPPRIDTLLGIQMFFGLFGFAILGLMYSRKRPNLTDLALFLCFSLLGLTALRNTVWFAIIIAPILCRYWTEVEASEISGLLRKRRWLNSTMLSDSTGSSTPKRFYGLNAALTVVGFCIVVLSCPWLGPKFQSSRLIDPATPVAAVDYIEHHQLQGRIFHPQIFGDYLIWRLYPLQRSFIDGRVHLFGESFVRRYQQMFYDSHWEDELNSFEIKYILLSKEKEQSESGNLIQLARSSTNWNVLFEDKAAVLFAKRND